MSNSYFQLMQRCIILLSQCSDGVAPLADDARNEVVVHCELTGMLETSVKVSSFKKLWEALYTKIRKGQVSSVGLLSRKCHSLNLYMKIYVSYIYTVIIGIYNLFILIYSYLFVQHQNDPGPRDLVFKDLIIPPHQKPIFQTLIASHGFLDVKPTFINQYQHNKFSGNRHIGQPTLDLFKHISGWWLSFNPSEKY